MYTLKVLKDFSHPDGRNFAVGHDCNALIIFEVAELVTEYPDHFKGGDELTTSLIADAEKMKHYAEAAKQQHVDYILSKKGGKK